MIEKKIIRIAKFVFCMSTFIISNLFFAQKNRNAILRTNSITEIENYLLTAHPDDPRVFLLKQRLINLKNNAWTEGAKYSKPMAPRPIENNPIMNNYSSEQEFEKLLQEARLDKEHKKNTISLLNTMFSNNSDINEAIILIKNTTNCNMVLNIYGKEKQYKLAVPSYKETPIVLPKGRYRLQGNLCNLMYNSEKELKKSLLIELTKR